MHIRVPPVTRQLRHTPTCVRQAGAEGMAEGEAQRAPRRRGGRSARDVAGEGSRHRRGPRSHFEPVVLGLQEIHLQLGENRTVWWPRVSSWVPAASQRQPGAAARLRGREDRKPRGAAALTCMLCMVSRSCSSWWAELRASKRMSVSFISFSHSSERSSDTSFFSGSPSLWAWKSL